MKVGDRIRYEIHWKNGQEKKADVTITDVLSGEVDYVSAGFLGEAGEILESLPEGWSVEEKDGTVTWTLEGCEAGAEGTVVLIVEVNVKALEKGKVENQANVKVGNDGKDTNIVENPAWEPEKTEPRQVRR